MKIKKVTFDQLEKYNQIEMLKVFDQIRVYEDKKDYTIKKVKRTVIDFAKEEKMDVWKGIMNHETCGIFVIEEDDTWVAGVVVVTNSPKVNMLQGDMSNAVLWDIRVDSKYQGKGYGKKLLQKAIEFAKNNGTERLLIECQNNNPQAIDFYERNGGVLYQLNKNHYQDYPEEDQLIFKIDFCDVRVGEISEFEQLWNYSETNTYKYFKKLISENVVEFWTIDLFGKLISELYIFWDSEDKDEANGINRAYLCAFRVSKDFQGKGYGSLLMNKVLKRIKEKGFNEVTIGVDNDEFNKLSSMYNHFGFKEHVKDSYTDLHYLDQNNQPVTYEESCMILLNRL